MISFRSMFGPVLATSVALISGACSSDPSASPGGDAGTSPSDAGGSQVDAGDAPDVTQPALDGGADGGGGGCSAAREQLLKPIATVSTGEVTVLSTASDVKTVYVDASAGGAPASSTNPRLYLSLATVTKVTVDDKAAVSSGDWDLAIKRPVLFTNGGHGGPGQGGAVFLPGVEFDTVTAASATGKTFAKEIFFDDDCRPQVDQTGAVKTSFDGWYDYDTGTNQVTPKGGTWLVKGASGKLYKLEILSYYATSDGGVGQAGGRYALRVGAL